MEDIRHPKQVFDYWAIRRRLDDH